MSKCGKHIPNDERMQEQTRRDWLSFGYGYLVGALIGTAIGLAILLAL